MTEAPPASKGQAPQGKHRKRKLLVWILGLLILGGGVLAGWYYFPDLAARAEKIPLAGPLIKEALQKKKPPSGAKAPGTVPDPADRTKELDDLQKSLDQKKAALDQRQSELDKREEQLKARETELGQAPKGADQAREGAGGTQEGAARLARIYAEMKPAEAAAILTKLDSPTVVKILAKMDDSQAARVLASLEPDQAAELSRLISGAR